MSSHGMRLFLLGLLALVSLGAAHVAPLSAMVKSPVTVEVAAPKMYVEGESLLVSIRLEVKGDKSAQLDSWALSAAAFSVNGHALGSRKGKRNLILEPGQIVETTLDLSAALTSSKKWSQRDFRLTYHGVGKTDPQEVRYFAGPEKGINFMELPLEQLADYQVVMITNRGDFWFELWPEVAPNHVRNFLDLSYTGFYDGTKFHRVIPGFMIQGGKAKSGTRAPRTVNAEFSDRKHMRGILSAARPGHDINGASSEFFVMHSTYPSLDGEYTPYGKLLEGESVIDLIVKTGNRAYSPNSPQGYTPMTPQILLRALVVKKTNPSKRKNK
ncbi:MAG: peptidylprolyl isomerase [Planctomycetes bacterium]|nr:peptidylprolyl isomerase [Planctomycetota bacterium]